MATPTVVPELENRPWTYALGAPVRGDTTKKEIALIFTGGEFGEGTSHVLDALDQRTMRASFFVTGDFIRQPSLEAQLRRAVQGGHYIGPHSDAHPLYCAWDDRPKTLVTEAFFRRDLEKNIADLRALGAELPPTGEPIYFIPPYEWYNGDQVQWSQEMGVVLFNFTPGSGSNRDFAPEGHKSFVPSQRLVNDILAYEQKDPHGLNGFLLLLHLGSRRTDKVHPFIPPLLDELAARGYTFVKVNDMLR